MNALAKTGLAVMVALLLTAPADAQTLGALIRDSSPVVSFKPVLMPVSISVDADGNVRYEITGTVTTPLGDITFSGDPKPKLAPGPDFAKYREEMQRGLGAMQRKPAIGDNPRDTRAKIEAFLNPVPPADLARKVTALEEENRRLRAKLLAYEAANRALPKTPAPRPGDQSKTPAGREGRDAITRPGNETDSTRVRPFSGLLGPKP